MLYFGWCVFELRARRETLARQNRLQELQQRTAQQGLVFKAPATKELGNLSNCFKIILLDSIFITKSLVCFFKLAHKKQMF